MISCSTSSNNCLIYIDMCIGLQINIIYSSCLLFIPLGSSVWPLPIRNASWALRMESRDVRMISNGRSSMSWVVWLLLVKFSETVVCLKEEVGLSTDVGLRWKFKSPFCLYCVLFVASSTVYHLNKIFWVTVDVVWTLSCLSWLWIGR